MAQLGGFLGVFYPFGNVESLSGIVSSLVSSIGKKLENDVIPKSKKTLKSFL